MKKRIFFKLLSVAVLSVLVSSMFACLAYAYDALILMVISIALGVAVAGIGSFAVALTYSDRLTQIEDGLRCMNTKNYLPSQIEEIDSSDLLYPITREISQLNKSINKRIINEKNEKAKIQQVIDNVSQGIIALNYKGKMALINSSALRMFEGSENSIGEGLSHLINDRQLLTMLNSYKDEDGSFDYKVGGKELSFAIKIIFDKNLSKKISRIIIVTDITKQKNMARQKSDFFANASHELKTPITVMQGLTELLLAKQTIDESTKKQIERIHKESLRMASLIADMLKLSKLERSEQSEELSCVNLRHVSEEIFGELSTQLQEKSVSWEITGEGDVVADSKKIFELMGNILSNAVNYNKENGTIKVILSQTKEQTVIIVRDTGIGIEKEHLPRLCKRFYRVDKSRSKKTGGTGLGLAIVKHICALYSAELEIESRMGEGTQVRVTFNNIAN